MGSELSRETTRQKSRRHFRISCQSYRHASSGQRHAMSRPVHHLAAARGTQTRSIRLHTHRRPGSPQYGSDPQWGKCVPTLSAHAPLPSTHACAACKMHVPAHCRRARGLNAGERRLRKIDRRYRRRGRLTSRVICGVQLRESNVPHAAPSDVRTLWRLEAAVEEATRRARYTSVNSLQR